MNMIGKAGLKSRLMQCAAASVFGAVLATATPAAAQQTVPGVSPNCPIVDGEAVCEGDLEDGVTASPGGTPFDTITIQNATTPIAPPGYFGIGVVRNTDTTINIADDIVIDVYDDPLIGGAAQGLIAIVGNGGDLVIDTGADITANGNGSIALGIEAVTQNGDGNLDIVNRGDINAFSSFPSAVAIQGRQENSTGRITIQNSGNLTATSGGTGERDFVTAGLLARHETGGGDIEIVNSGAISVSATTTDTDFNGVAAGIVTNSFIGANTTNITNSGAIDATGNAVHGIVGFTHNSSMSDAATLNVVNEATGTLAIDGSVNYGMLVQTAGTHVNSSATNAAAITMANGDSSTGIMMLNRAQTASINLNNEGDISGEGSSLRGLGVFTFQAPVGGDYDILIDNSGDITLDTPLGRGISIAVTEEDTAIANVVNSGNIDMANTTDANSHGIGLNFEIIDPNAAGAMADSAVTLMNSGDITMGSGAGIWLVADSITAENSGDIFMGDGAGMLISDFNDLSLINSGSIAAAGDGNSAISAITDNDEPVISIESSTGTLSASGAGSYGILAQSVGSAAATTIANTSAITIAYGDGSTAISLQTGAPDASVVLYNSGDIIAEGSDLRGLDVVTTNAPVAGEYNALVRNEGDITLDTDLGLGIAISNTIRDSDLTEDGGTVFINAVNSGDIDLSSSTDANSYGMYINANNFDGSLIEENSQNNVTVSNGGSISIGTGTGIFANGGSLTLSNSGAITTTGANSDGIVVDASDAVEWEVVVEETGSVTTSGPGSVGIRVTGVTDDYREVLIHETTAAVTVEKAKLADRAMNAITQYVTSTAPGNGGVSSASSVSKTQAGSIAPANHGGAADVGSVMVNGTVTSNGGAGAILGEGALRVSSDNAGAVISTTGDNAPVISAQSSLYLYSDEGLTLSSTGANAPLFQVLGGGDNTAFVALDHVNASTTGNGSTAFWLDGQGGDSVALFDVGGLDPASPSTISTMGDNADAVRFVTTGSSTFAGLVDDTEITTTGDSSAGLNLDLGMNSSANLALADTSVTTGGANSDAVHIGVGDGSDVLLLLERSAIATTGAGSDAIDVPQVANSSIGNAVIIDSSISTTGDDARGFVFTDQGGDATSRTVFVKNSDFATQGHGAAALLFGANGSSSAISTTIEDAMISTAGSNAHGINQTVSGDGSAVDVTIENTTIETAGAANSGALFLDGTVDNNSAYTLQLAGLDFSTTGTQSDAIFIGGGGFDESAFNTNVLDAVLTTEGDDSRGLVIDQFIASDNSISVSTMNNITVSTTGARASGIVLGTSGDGAMVMNSSSTITFDNLDITTAGDNARGLQVQGLSANLTGNMIDSDWAMLFQNSVISTSGNNANGVEIFGVGGTLSGSTIALVSTGVDVTTTGDRSDGFVVGSIPEVGASETNSTDLALSFGTITTTGENADAIRIGTGWGTPDAQAVRDGGGFSRLATLEISEDVSATGPNSDGLVTRSLINALRLTASGTLSADGFAILSQGAGGIEDLTNEGTITGDIRLGDEDSTLTNAGTITGNIDMGGGANSLMIGETGVLNSLDQILIGDGNAITVAGVIAPGGDGPMQTTMVGSDLVFEAGSSYLVDISGTAADPSLTGIGMSDRLEVDGSVTINGGDVVVSSLTPEGDFTDLADYRIIGGADGVTGMFEGLDADLPFLNLSLVYNPDSVLLRAERLGFGSDAVPFASIARTPNQQAVAEAFDVIEDDATGDMDVVIDQLVFSSEAQALTAYDQTSGDVYAALLSQSSHGAIASAQRLVARAHARSAEGWGIWAGASGRDGSIDGDGNAAGLDHDESGLDFGVDYAAPGNAWAVGASAGLIEGSATVSDRMSSADYDGWRLGGYARHGNGNTGLGLTAAVDYSQTDAEVSRDITVNALSRMAVGTVGAETLAVSAEARYGFAALGGWALGPVASVTSASSDFDAISETGADSLNLVGGLASHDATRFGAGMFANWQGERGTADIAAQYVDGDSDTARLETSFAGAPGAAFTVIGPEVESAGVMISAAGSYALGGGWTLGGEVSALTGNDQESVAGGLTLGWAFP